MAVNIIKCSEYSPSSSSYFLNKRNKYIIQIFYISISIRIKITFHIAIKSSCLFFLGYKYSLLNISNLINPLQFIKKKI